MIGRNCYLYIPGKKGRLHLGRKVIIGDNVEIQAQGSLSIGAHSTINRNSRIIAFENITLGHHLTAAQFISILDHDHDYQMENNKLQLSGYKTAPISIGNYVWIGDKVTITKGVTIGDNVIIGAHTLVNKNVPSNCIIGGNPFKILKELS